MNKKIIFFSLLIPGLLGMLIFSSCQKGTKRAAWEKEEFPSKTKVNPVITVKAHPFNLKQVHLLDGPFKKAMERDRNYLHDLNPDRLLHNFRVNAGLPSSAEPYGGWEKPDVELRGHTVGHFLSACALMYASTGDEKLKQKAEYIVSELGKCQEALGKKGYLSAFPETFFDRAEATEDVWAPYYTLHKIFAGLQDMYVYCDNTQALEMAQEMANWVKVRTDKLNKKQRQKMLDHTEQGGMNETLSNLYSLTGNQTYLELAHRFDQKSYLKPLSEYKDQLKSQHVNSFIPNMIGTAREYELTGERELYNIATFFWNQVTRARCFVTGGTSNREIWGSKPYHISKQLGPHSHETCCTFNMLKLTRHLFTWQPKPKYADYYERALFNGILPTQNPENGMMMYYVPMASGYYKTFMSPYNSFWCCTGTGMENHAKYGDSIYFHDQNGVYINLFIASELSWREKGLHLRQTTKFPQEEKTTLEINLKEPSELAFYIRIPYWIEKGGYVNINGKKLDAFTDPSSYLKIKRTWKDGDKIEVHLPMGLHLQRTPDNPHLGAVMYGPLVLAGDLGGLNLPHDKIFGKYGPSEDPVSAPQFEVDKFDPSTWIKPVSEKPLTFQTQGVGNPQDVQLIPFYKLFNQRYAVYWKIIPASKENP